MKSETTATKTFAVQDIDALTMAFPASVWHLMPKYSEIPAEFKHGHGTWNRLVSDWFFGGVINLNLTPRDGIDTKKALRHIKAILGSFEPKHEHKEAACAYLLSLWFTDAKWDRKR